jgi:hypothetical protein
MKQIKVVARGIATTPEDDALNNGIINVSFNEPVTIEAGSRIALDKFFCRIIDGTLKANFGEYPDLAIEMSSLNIESYDSDKKGRRNVVAYFSPQPWSGNQDDEGAYLFEAKTLSYLSINNEMDIDIGTIVFRVVDIKTGQGFKANYVSFNVIVG